MKVLEEFDRALRNQLTLYGISVEEIPFSAGIKKYKFTKSDVTFEVSILESEIYSRIDPISLGEEKAQNIVDTFTLSEVP